MKTLATFSLLAAIVVAPALAQGLPSLQKSPQTGRSALMVDGKPYLMLGGQINNSSSWPVSLPAAWASLAALHVNTVEAPVYWEQIEPARDKFDFANVDLLVAQAREHHLHLVLLWFGTWKNGQNHYVPEWVKADTVTYPREVTAYGKLLDVMSPNSTANLEADKHAFAALMRHVKEIGSTQHTIIMVQVENESGSVGSVRDFSPAAEKLFAADVPTDLARTLHLRPGSWTKVFGPDADESFAAWSTARYIGEVARAGKAEYPLPMYCNVWIVYPVHALENRDRPSPGQEYPSGGPEQPYIAIWKAAAPAIDILAPDFYSDDNALFRQTIATYTRTDNPLFIPETRLDQYFGRNLFYSLNNGAIGFSPFGVDRPNRPQSPEPARPAVAQPAPPIPAENFALLNPIAQQIAQLNYDGKLKTAVEEKGAARQVLHFPATPGSPAIDAVLSFGYPQSDGAFPPGTPDLQGRALVAQIGPMEFLVAGFDASVSFRLASDAQPSNRQLEILRAEEGQYFDSAWTPSRILNGDQTDRGLNFRGQSAQPLVHIRLHTLPLYDDAVRSRRAD
jgi:hypothetical protein